MHRASINPGMESGVSRGGHVASGDLRASGGVEVCGGLRGDAPSSRKKASKAAVMHMLGSCEREKMSIGAKAKARPKRQERSERL